MDKRDEVFMAVAHAGPGTRYEELTDEALLCLKACGRSRSCQVIWVDHYFALVAMRDALTAAEACARATRKH